MGRSGTCATAAMAFGFAPFAPALAAGGPFDGVWDVQIDCPTGGDVEGYTWRFPAEVSSGFFSGLFHSTTSSAVGHITGQIHPNGGALLMMAEPEGCNALSATIVRERTSDTLSTLISTRTTSQASATSRGLDERPIAQSFVGRPK